MKKDVVLEKLIRYIEINGTKANGIVRAIYKGVCPEDGSGPVYYLVGKHKYDFNFEEEITMVDLGISRITGKQFTLSAWPINPEDAGDYEFLGEIVYSREIPKTK